MLGVLSSDENQDGAQTPKFTQRSNEFMISPRLEMEIFSQELAQTRQPRNSEQSLINGVSTNQNPSEEKQEKPKNKPIQAKSAGKAKNPSTSKAKRIVKDEKATGAIEEKKVVVECQKSREQKKESPGKELTRRMEQSLFHFTHNKAGMDGLDRQKINQIILEASKGSAYYQREQRKLAQNQKKIKHYRAKLEAVDKVVLQRAKQVVAQQISTLESQRNINRTWMHVDMDMFYAAVQIRQNPQLANVPMAVGQSIISTANYIARKYGVRSAMPGFIAQKLCPNLVFVKSNHGLYSEVSKVFKGVLYQYDPNLESMGIDEANLDVTEWLETNGMNNDKGREALAQFVRKEIKEKTQLTATCGIACNKMLAKMCSEIRKPDNYFYLAPEVKQIKDFIQRQPVRKIPGIGRMQEQILMGLNITTCKDIIDRAPQLYIIFSETQYNFLIQAALGISRNMHDLEDLYAPPSSVSTSETFKTITTKQEFIAKLEEIAEELAQRVEHKEVVGRTVTLELKNTKFEVKNRGVTQKNYISTKEELFKAGREILEMLWPHEPIRLMGLKLSNLKEKETFEEEEKSGIKSFFQQKSTQEYLKDLEKKKAEPKAPMTPQTRVESQKEEKTVTTKKKAKKNESNLKIDSFFKKK